MQAAVISDTDSYGNLQIYPPGIIIAIPDHTGRDTCKVPLHPTRSWYHGYLALQVSKVTRLLWILTVCFTYQMLAGNCLGSFTHFNLCAFGTAGKYIQERCSRSPSLLCSQTSHCQPSSHSPSLSSMTSVSSHTSRQNHPHCGLIYPTSQFLTQLRQGLFM